MVFSTSRFTPSEGLEEGPFKSKVEEGKNTLP